MKPAEQKQMTPKEHRERHKLLHDHLDELIADWLTHHPMGTRPSTSTILELMEWSYQQTVQPTERDGMKGDKRELPREAQVLIDQFPNCARADCGHPAQAHHVAHGPSNFAPGEYRVKPGRCLEPGCGCDQYSVNVENPRQHAQLVNFPEQ